MSPAVEPGSEPGEDPQATDLPLDAHLHTDQSPDSRVPIDVYAAAAVARGIRELAITDHVDFDARDPAYGYATFADRERTVRTAAERWAGHGLAIRFGVELTFNTAWEDDLRAHLRRHRYDYAIGSVHDWPGSPYVPDRVATWVANRSIAEIVAPYVEQVTAAARSGLFDTIGHLDVVKRYVGAWLPPGALHDHAELFEPPLRALVDSGTALEVNTSGLRQRVGETYPAPWAVARFRELGGRRIVAGSDAHRPDWLAWGLEAGYRIIGEAGFEELAFRRGAERVVIELPARFRPTDRGPGAGDGPAGGGEWPTSSASSPGSVVAGRRTSA